jgi:hypothetical protein
VLELAVFFLVPSEAIKAVAIEYSFRDGTFAETCTVPETPSRVAPPFHAPEAINYHARYIAGRYNMAVASGFIALVSLFTILFGATIIAQRAGVVTLLVLVAVFIPLSECASDKLVKYPYGRALIFDISSHLPTAGRPQWTSRQSLQRPSC